MAVKYGKLHSVQEKTKIEKQLFKDIRKLIHYLDARKAASEHPDERIMDTYEQMIKDRCDVLGEIDC